MLEHYILRQQKYTHTYYLRMMRVMRVHKFIWVFIWFCVCLNLTFKWTPTGTTRLKSSLFLFLVIEQIKLVPEHFISLWSWTVQPNFRRGVQDPRQINGHVFVRKALDSCTRAVACRSSVNKNSYLRNIEWLLHERWKKLNKYQNRNNDYGNRNQYHSHIYLALK